MFLVLVQKTSCINKKTQHAENEKISHIFAKQVSYTFLIDIKFL